MVIQGERLIQAMEKWAPASLAVEKDRIGLQVGSHHEEVQGVLVALDVTEEVVDEAIRIGANWIVAHHAVIFHPLTELRTDQAGGRLYGKLLQHGIQVYVAHTNLDAAVGGVNDVLSEGLDLEETQVMIPTYHQALKKIAVMVPTDYHDQLLQAMCRAGAGWIGNYSHCTFNLTGIGTFRPEAGTQPFIGREGELERVEEVRLETVVPAEIQQAVIQVMIQAHPYEEPAFDIYPLEVPGEVQGMGRVGKLPQKMMLKDLAQKIKNVYGIPCLRMVGEETRYVSTVAVLGGSGGRYYPKAIEMGADVYITGDVDHHTALDALRDGLTLLDPGHHVEHLVLDRIVARLKETFGEKACPIQKTTVDTNPFQFV